MRTKLSLLALTVLVGAAFSAPAGDEIKDLPGLSYNISFQHYSGYLDGDKGKHLHYWLTTSQNSRDKDPLVLWMNGGPGCSSMEGLLGELGPYRVDIDGKTLIPNKYAWNMMANVLFLESPACVGFSYDDDHDCKAGDDSTSMNNYLALVDFFKKFPEFAGRDFYVTGESYGGIYVPTLTVRILQGNAAETSKINLKGIAIGNGLSSYRLNDDSLVFFGYYHGLYGDDLWRSLINHCCKKGDATRFSCNFYDSYWPLCKKAVSEAEGAIYREGLNIYNLYLDCTNDTVQQKGEELLTTSKPGLSRYQADAGNLFRKNFKFGRNDVKNKATQIDPRCFSDDALHTYMSQLSVREALHIPDDLPRWAVCNDEVNANFERNYDNMTAQYQMILKAKVRVLIYNGDVDMACNFLGDEWFVEDLGLKVVEKRRAWKESGQIAGFVKRFENLDLLTVRGSGHMVPEDKPGPAFKMITSFLYQKPY